MADRRLRDLERSAPSDPQTRARWLRERVRAGRLGRPWLELLAHLGDEAAGIAVGDPLPVALPSLATTEDYDAWCAAQARRRGRRARLRDLERSFDPWARALWRWGGEVFLRAQLAGIRLLLVDRGEELPDAVLGDVLREVAAGRPLASPEALFGGVDDPVANQVTVACEATLEAARDGRASRCGLHGVRFQLARARGRRAPDDPRPRLRIRAAVRDALVPWVEDQTRPLEVDLDELALLRRVGRGAVSKRRLGLAAFLGHPPAVAAEQACGLDPVAPARDGVEWAWRLARSWGPKVAVRTAVLAAARALPLHDAAHPTDDAPGDVLAAAEAWVERATRSRTEAVHGALRAVAGRLPATDDAPGQAALACLYAGHACLEPRSAAASEAVFRAADAVGDPPVQAAVRDGLLAWALGRVVHERARATSGPGER